MLPEEQELTRLETEQGELEERVASAELSLETIKTETARFQRRYYQTVGRLYAELDELDAKFADAQAARIPGDAAARADAQAAHEQARKSAEEAGLIEVCPGPPPAITPELKQAYRQAAKLIHPDRATTDRERQRRTTLMAQVNRAYERGDKEAIEKLILEYGHDPEAIAGADIASRIVRAIRRIAQLRRRLTEAQEELEVHQATELFQLRKTVEEAEAMGGDPLNELAQQLMQELSERGIQLEMETCQ
ncbi:J domain-containing protein [Paraburkholderia phymatum]|uniref:Heat shock protein DnaJ domain protein n=1 Tax=Paraburkholderia phymatum (strain DSM 17167 / CIP 108236 / LMG 21445 / STM815) TaxID=391038 RepID=B2JTI1_PARP8|nr:J domain-containing protein [Paraburkholderia phymatum]ACC75884.1 heat shock protein DnaJ domain protein [Paraburkholderia phymatum STM815]